MHRENTKAPAQKLDLGMICVWFSVQHEDTNYDACRYCATADDDRRFALVISG